MQRRHFAKALGYLVGLFTVSQGRIPKPAECSQPKEYIALLNQLDDHNPSVIVLKNALGGEVIWTRWSPGYHHGFLEGAFPGDRTICRKPSVDTDAAQHEEYDAWLMRANDDMVTVIVKNRQGEPVDSAANLPIEIRVYPAP